MRTDLPFYATVSMPDAGARGLSATGTAIQRMDRGGAHDGLPRLGDRLVGAPAR